MAWLLVAGAVLLFLAAYVIGFATGYPSGQRDAYEESLLDRGDE